MGLQTTACLTRLAAVHVNHVHPLLCCRPSLLPPLRYTNRSGSLTPSRHLRRAHGDAVFGIVTLLLCCHPSPVLMLQWFLGAIKAEPMPWAPW
jgi:hypothetical protein